MNNPTTTELRGPTPTRACGDCLSTDIAYDAYINVNDPTDVRTFDTIDCLACGGHDIDTITTQKGTCDIYRALDVHSRTDAIHTATTLGLIPTTPPEVDG